MGETEIVQRFQGGVIDVVEFPDAIFNERSIFLTGFVGIAKEPDKQLVNSEFRSA